MKLDRVIAVRNNKTVFRDGNRCVKIFSTEFSKSAVFAEALNHTKVEEYVDFMPKLLEVIRHGEKWAIVYEFIKGKTLRQWMEEEPQKLAEQVEFFVNAQRRLHGVVCQTPDGMKARFAAALTHAPLDEKLKETLRQRLEQTEFSSALCHCELVPSNVIVTEDASPLYH